MLDQFESLIQPTQFLEHLRRTIPMSETLLDVLSSTRDLMLRSLNTLEMLYKGRLRAVDKFMSSTLTGLARTKANALQKAKKSSVSAPARKQTRRGGGSGGGYQGNRGPPVMHQM
jgi:hypothetical protein